MRNVETKKLSLMESNQSIGQDINFNSVSITLDINLYN